MTLREFINRLAAAVRAVRPGRLIALLLAALAAGLAGDWLQREQRVVFPRPLPQFITEPTIR